MPILAGSIAACGARSAADMSATEKKAIADSLKHLVVNTYDLSKPNAVQRLMSLYPNEGRVISASGGVTTTTRPKLEEAIKAFWTYVGQNMHNPKWEWTSMTVDVLAPDAAVMTSTYAWRGSSTRRRSPGRGWGGRRASAPPSPARPGSGR